MLKKTLQRFAIWHERFGWILTLIAIPSIVKDLQWWGSFFGWLLQSSPKWFSLALSFFSEYITPILDAYSRMMIAVFSVLPFAIPNWLSAALPPIVMITSSLLMSLLNKRRLVRFALKDIAPRVSEKTLENVTSGRVWKTMDKQDRREFSRYHPPLMKALKAYRRGIILATSFSILFFSVFLIELVFINS